jgi:cytochrome c oxidase subunit 2
MRVLWTWSGVAALCVGILVWGLIFWCCIRYRKKNDELPRQTKYNLPLEIVYTIIPFVIIAGLFYRTAVVENDVNKVSKHPDVTVQVNAFKWNWQFEYQNYRDTSGTHTTAYAAEAGKPSMDGYMTDPQSLTKDEWTDKASPHPLYLSTVGTADEIPVLVIPVGQSVKIIEHSEDVIHSFWVPEFLFKRDVIPWGTESTAHDNVFQIEPTTPGSYVGRCAELCGTYHSQMNFEVRVVQPAVFVKYLAALNKLGPNNPTRQYQALKAAGMAPCATTTVPFNTDRNAASPVAKQGACGES